MQVPQIDLFLETERLHLEPIEVRHAELLVDVLSDASIYCFIPLEPPSLEKLQAQYTKWQARISPEKDEIWLNWAVRLKDNGAYIGYFQASYKEDKRVYLGYVLNTSFHGKGYAFEGLSTILAFLFKKLDAVSVKAWIDTRNEKSISLVKKLGMAHIETLPKADHFKGQDSDEFVFELTSENWPGRTNSSY